MNEWGIHEPKKIRWWPSPLLEEKHHNPPPIGGPIHENQVSLLTIHENHFRDPPTPPTILISPPIWDQHPADVMEEHHFWRPPPAGVNNHSKINNIHIVFASQSEIWYCLVSLVIPQVSRASLVLSCLVLFHILLTSRKNTIFGVRLRRWWITIQYGIHTIFASQSEIFWNLWFPWLFRCCLALLLCSCFWCCLTPKLFPCSLPWQSVSDLTIHENHLDF